MATDVPRKCLCSHAVLEPCSVAFCLEHNKLPHHYMVTGAGELERASERTPRANLSSFQEHHNKTFEELESRSRVVRKGKLKGDAADCKWLSQRPHKAINVFAAGFFWSGGNCFCYLS